MLKQLLGKVFNRQRQWTESEIRHLIDTGAFERAQMACEMLHAATPERELRQICLQAEIAFRNFQDEIAEILYARALKLAPGFADAHYGLSLLHHAREKHDIAFQHALFAKNIKPNEARYLAQLGLCHIALGNYPMAMDPLQQAVRFNSTDKSAWNNLGIAQRSKGLLADARASFEAALRIDPQFQQAQINLRQLEEDQSDTNGQRSAPSQGQSTHPTNLLRTVHEAESTDNRIESPWQTDWELIQAHINNKQAAAAMQSAEQLLLRHPDSASLALHIDIMYRNLGEPDSGLSVLKAFVSRYPSDGLAHLGLGNSLLFHGMYAEAESHLKRARELGENSGELLRNLGTSLSKQERFAEAHKVYIEYHDLYFSDVSLAYLASSHVQICQYDLALSLFAQLDSGGYIAKHGMETMYAAALAYDGQIEKALTLMDAKCAEHPNAPSLRALRAQMRLQLEDFAGGWDDYRFRNLNSSRFFRVLPVQEWQGEELDGKTIVVLAEQGLGDQIMLASCLSDLLSLQPKRVVVEAVTRVAPTLARSFPECEVISTRQDKGLDWLREIDGIDFYVPLGELPRFFRRSLSAFPAQPYLKPDPNRVVHWRDRMRALGPGPYIGTSWRGGTEKTRSVIRTLDPSQLISLQDDLGGQWISLQYGDVTNELASAASAGMALTHWAEGITDLDEFAALCAALDGIVTVCNTTVHYAGAVGQHVWVMAPHVPEWRYGLHHEHMPWYPHVKVLRQQSPNDWASVMDSISKKLRCHFRIDKNCHTNPASHQNLIG